MKLATRSESLLYVTILAVGARPLCFTSALRCPQQLEHNAEHRLQGPSAQIHPDSGPYVFFRQLLTFGWSRF